MAQDRGRVTLEQQAQEVRHSAVPKPEPSSLAPEIASVLALQRSAGNQAVARMLSGGGRMLARDKGFDDVAAAGGATEAAAPVTIKLPPELSKGLEDAWKDSFPGGKSQEQIGLLVKKKDGTYAWKRSAKPGTSGSATPNYGDLAADETLIAVAHTHPYDKDEGGHKGISFSGADLSRLVLVNERMAVVNAGDAEFVAVKSKEFDDMVKPLDGPKKQALVAEMDKLWKDTYAASTGKPQGRVEAAVKAVCEKYHLLYYKGSVGGTLSRVTPKVVVTSVKDSKETAEALAGVGAETTA